VTPFTLTPLTINAGPTRSVNFALDDQDAGISVGSLPDCLFLPDNLRRQPGQNLMILDLARLLLFPALMAFAAASDLFTMTISNRVSLALLGGFLGLALLSGMGMHDILSHVGAGAAVLAVAFACFAFGWIGGGDAKIAGGAALWFGFAHLLDYLVYASLFGGALTLLLLQFRQWPLPYSLGGQAWLLKLHAKDTGIPYGIALAVGALMIYPETDWIKAVDLARFAVQ
jgi:prepilin peptidase CpaA